MTFKIAPVQPFIHSRPPPKENGADDVVTGGIKCAFPERLTPDAPTAPHLT